jgi:hypothetical protein
MCRGHPVVTSQQEVVMSEPFEPIVESLLKYAVDSPQFIDAAEVAGPAEIAEACRQLEATLGAFEARQRDVEGKLSHLAEQYPELRGGD